MNELIYDVFLGLISILLNFIGVIFNYYICSYTIGNIGRFLLAFIILFFIFVFKAFCYLCFKTYSNWIIYSNIQQLKNENINKQQTNEILETINLEMNRIVIEPEYKY